jgi:hypothetical protein
MIYRGIIEGNLIYLSKYGITLSFFDQANKNKDITEFNSFEDLVDWFKNNFRSEVRVSGLSEEEELILYNIWEQYRELT